MTRPESAPLLDCRSVDFAYGRRTVLREIDLTIHRGEVIGIIGPNGAGKSTLLHILVGCLSPRGGEVAMEGTSLHEWGVAELARRLAVVPQATPLVFGHRVADIVAMGRHPHRSTLQWSPTADDEAAVLAALKRTDTLRLADRRFNELSGGEQQLALIARALAQSSEVLLLDEPTASLDLHHQARVIGVLRRLHREAGTTLVWIAHDLNLVSQVCRRIVLLAEGRIIADGTREEILTTDRLSETYRAPVTVEVTADGRRRVELDLRDGEPNGDD